MTQMEARRVSGQARVLDVRGATEFESGHVPDALHIPHTRVALHLDEIPRRTPLTVHCNSGARSAAVVSLLERHGFEPIQVNDLFANYRRTDVRESVTAGERP